MRCLEANPEDRPTAAHLVQQLAQLQKQAPSPPLHPPPSPPCPPVPRQEQEQGRGGQGAHHGLTPGAESTAAEGSANSPPTTSCSGASRSVGSAPEGPAALDDQPGSRSAACPAIPPYGSGLSLVHGQGPTLARVSDGVAVTVVRQGDVVSRTESPPH